MTTPILTPNSALVWLAALVAAVSPFPAPKSFPTGQRGSGPCSTAKP